MHIIVVIRPIIAICLRWAKKGRPEAAAATVAEVPGYPRSSSIVGAAADDSGEGVRPFSPRHFG